MVVPRWCKVFLFSAGDGCISAGPISAKPRRIQEFRGLGGRADTWPAGCLFPRQPDANNFWRRGLRETDKLAASRDWARDTEQGLQGSGISGKEPKKTA
jgi:hypothetical protein